MNRTFLLRFFPLTVLGVGAFIFYEKGWDQLCTFEVLRYHHFEILEQVKQHPLMGFLILIAVYVVGVCFCLPQIPFLIAFSGYLFPSPVALFCPVFGLSLGCLFLFFSFRPLFSVFFFLKKQSSFSLLFFRILFGPFFIQIPTSLAALFPTSWARFYLTSFIGLTPFCFFLSHQGRFLQESFENLAILSYSFSLPLNCYLYGFFFCLLAFCFKKFENKSKLINIEQETKD